MWQSKQLCPPQGQMLLLQEKEEEEQGGGEEVVGKGTQAIAPGTPWATTPLAPTQGVLPQGVCSCIDLCAWGDRLVSATITESPELHQSTLHNRGLCGWTQVTHGGS